MRIYLARVHGVPQMFILNFPKKKFIFFPYLFQIILVTEYYTIFYARENKLITAIHKTSQ